jgi:N-methylhydantoinase A/oxoprolinase/acetone carboxylase beta subunit
MWPGSQTVRQTDIYDSEALGPGVTLSGPALVEGPATSVLIPSAWRLKVDAYGNYIVNLAG